jgi:hypothetical protein
MRNARGESAAVYLPLIFLYLATITLMCDNIEEHKGSLYLLLPRYYKKRAILIQMLTLHFAFFTKPIMSYAK